MFWLWFDTQSIYHKFDNWRTDFSQKMNEKNNHGGRASEREIVSKTVVKSYRIRISLPRITAN